MPLLEFCVIFCEPQDSYLRQSTRFKPNFQTSKRLNLLIESAFVRRYKKSICGKKFFCTPQDVNIIFPFEQLKTHFIPYLTSRQHYIINEFLIHTEDRVGHLLTCNCYNLTDLYTLTVQSDWCWRGYENLSRIFEKMFFDENALFS